ncbi:ABC-type multidrug transport system ATPase subunit [Deinococcus sp. HSC-46F16]|uniref:ABC transporter ATP-binding protein n=1 Tax=Deinococcus sp. HSC-46F16 TaxID=2910968 RepID=UPI0020A04EFD|nr:ABC-type multidrug transport system ATPase subunit [Deinococcus sp. HSC-46F16]
MILSSEDGPPLLSAHDVHLAVAGRTVVEIDTLEVHAGELVHLRGENGAGKTTLLRAVAGETPHGGRLRIAGHPPGSLAARARTAFVPTDPTLLDDLTLAENLTFLSAAWHQPPDAALDLAEAFGLAPWLDAWPMSLSRGTRQKAALSLHLGLALPLTLLDEPFSTLDVASRDVLRRAIAGRVREGGTVVITTHGDELSGMATRPLDLVGGRLREPVGAAW